MHTRSRTANLLGAAALAASDLSLARLRAEGLSTSGAAALVTLSAQPGLTGTELGRRIGLTQSAAVRLLDGLVSAGLVRREPHQGRSVAVQLTKAGRERAQQLLAARGDALADLLDGLGSADQRQLAGLLEKLLARVYADVRSSDQICRLCDRTTCTTHAVCPVGAAERADQGG